MGQKVLEPGKNNGDDACGMETLLIEQTVLSRGNEDVEVNITGCTNSGKALVMQDSCEDVTECSSSFGDTGSGTENGPSFSDIEVESRMCANNASSVMCDDWHESLRGRKKRMTIHWRKFIGPIMWRCKWIELQLKQLQSQALKYDKELMAYNHTKQHDFAHLTLDGSAIKSVPISGRMHRNKVMKRNKRKRVEEKCDIASYMSNHSLFSYYEKTDFSVDARSKDCHGVAIGGSNDNNEEFKLNDLWSSVEHENDKSLDDIIQKIEAIQSQVQKLKYRYDKVISENQGKFCSVKQLSMPGPSDILNHSNPKLPSFDGHKGMIPLIKATDRPDLDGAWEDTKDEVLIQNQVAKEELHDFENFGNQLVEITKESPVEENKAISHDQVLAPDSGENTLKSCSTLKANVSRNKRKGRKKSGSKRWNRRLSG